MKAASTIPTGLGRVALAILLAGMSCSFLPRLASAQTGETDVATAFAREAGQRVKSQPSVRGDDRDWFFLVRELRHLATGRFWEKSWEEVARNGSDPVPGIVEFHRMLQERDVDLLLVPVPAKAAIYPDKLDADFAPGDVARIGPFLERVREAGVTVIDLEPAFLEARLAGEGDRLYCRQDAHFSPRAVERVAARIAEALGPEERPNESPEFTVTEAEELEIVGDQVRGSEWEGRVAPERLTARRVTQGGEPGVEPDRDSPVLLLGDSHTLVFHAGEGAGMHCRGAGVADHLSLRLGLPVDLVGVRGSGLVQARKRLFYHATSAPGYWDGKRAVVWLFSVREFTQSNDRFIRIPLER